MTAYSAILSARFRTLLQYRAAALAGLGTQLFWGFIRVMIFDAFYRSTTQAQPMTYAQVVTYVWLGQGLLALLPLNTDGDIRTMIRNGTVAYEMLRPIDLYGLWFCRAVAARTAPTLLRAVPLFTFALLFFGMQGPASGTHAFACMVALIGALLLSAAFSTLMNISLMLTVAGDGVVRFALSFVYLFSGLALPMVFFPAWFQPLLYTLPFRGMMDTPFRLYTGNIAPPDIPMVLLHQGVWIVVLVGIGRLFLARATRHLVVQGG